MEGAVDSVGCVVAEKGSGVDERLEILLESSSSSSSSLLAWDLVRFLLTPGPRDKGGGFVVFFVLFSAGDPLAGMVFIGVGFDETVKPAVTFLIALIPVVLLFGFVAAAGADAGVDAGAGAGAGVEAGGGGVGFGTGSVEGIERAAKVAVGICIVI